MCIQIIWGSCSTADAASEGLGWEQRFHISDELPCDVRAAGLQAAHEEWGLTRYNMMEVIVTTDLTEYSHG